jgi:hypothetical protein
VPGKRLGLHLRSPRAHETYLGVLV